MEEEKFIMSSSFIHSNLYYYLMLILLFNFILVLYFKAKKKSREFLNQVLTTLGEKEVLIIIAHPDDETIFFFPTIKALVSKNIKVNILCLSNGNYYNLGKTRELEMKRLKEHLNLNSVEVIDNDKLKDDLLHNWDPKIVGNEISDYIKRNGNRLGVIFTFDSKGVTKHPNHISTHFGIR